MAIQQSKCSCGEAVEIRTGTDKIATMRTDGKQAVYPDDTNKAYSIFRCKTCLQPLDQTCPGYEYGESPSQGASK